MSKLKRLSVAFMYLSMSLSICSWAYANSAQTTETNIVDDVTEDDGNASVASSLTDEDAYNTTPSNVLNNDNLSSGGGKTGFRNRCYGRWR